MKEYLDLIEIQWPEVVVTILNLLILFGLMKKFLFKPVQKILAQREQQVNTLYADAEEAKATAEESRAAYAEKLRNAEAEADEVMRKAHERATAAGDLLVTEAVEKASAVKRKAEAEIAQERKKAVNDIKNEISEISVDIAEKVIGRTITDDDRRALVDGFIDSIGD